MVTLEKLNMNPDERLMYLNAALDAVFDQVTEAGYEVVYLALQGSQNYNLDTYTDEYVSDVDMKCFVMPSFEDLYFNKQVSTTLKTGFGQVEVKDLRLFTDLLGKMNSSYLELLYTLYYRTSAKYSTLVKELRSYRDKLVEERLPLLMKSMYGMCLEKQKALCHEYEGLKDKLETYGGYDPKQLHHALRMTMMMDGLMYGRSYSEVLKFEGTSRQFLLDVKVHGVNSKENAVRMMNKTLEVAQSRRNLVWDGNTLVNNFQVSSETLKNVRDLVFKMVKQGLMV